MASMILGSLGSSLLGPLGGFIGSAIGSAIDNWILASLAEPQEGPRLDDLSVVRADPGVAIPLVFGADRIPGIMVGSTELIETTKKERVGKGGGQKTITYSYHVDCDFMLCEGPILGIARIWADGNLWRGTRQQLEVDTKKHPENIGGIPYPPYYRDHLYEPSLIPWSIDRDNNIPVDDGNLYYMALNNQDMLFAGAAADTEIPEGYFKDSPAVVSYYDANPERGGLFGLGNHSSGERELLDILYWKDTSTGYYIPITERVGYTGEKITDVVSDEVKEHHIGNGVKSRHEYNGEGPEQLVMIDVRKETGSIIDEQSKASIAYALDINIYAMWGITQSFFYLTVNC